MRDHQGIHTLEAVQKFNEIIKQPPRKAGTVIKKLTDYCGNYKLEYHAVILLVRENSQTNEEDYHAVRVSHSQTLFLETVLVLYFKYQIHSEK